MCFLELFAFVFRKMFKPHLPSFSPTEKTRDELRLQVYDAMAEKNEDEQKQIKEKETKADTGEVGEEEQKSQVNESKSDKGENGTENEKEAEKESADKEEEEAEGNFNAASSSRGSRRSY